jgi:DNA-binding beta-propeller fold protein YncE
VGDRENNRVQVFDQNGGFIREFGGFAPFGLFITTGDTLFVADGRANKVLKMSLEGKVICTWGETGSGPSQFRMPHGITVARDGAVYVTEIDGKRVQKFVPDPETVPVQKNVPDQKDVTDQKKVPDQKTVPDQKNTPEK